MIRIPYGRTAMEARVSENNLLGVYSSRLPESSGNEAELVREALDHPIDSPPLEELAKGKKSAVVITSDHTRPVPSRAIMPQILERLRRNSPDIDITILVATGFHRGTTRAELVEKLGEEIVAAERIVVHDSGDAASLVNLGKLPSGGDLILNKLAVETELLVAEGFIEPHFFAGFSGGRKSVLPGIAARETVLANHCSEFIQSPYARTGNLDGNPIHRDMLFAAERVNLAFIVNVVIDHDKRIVRAFAGDREKAHRAGCEFLEQQCRIEVPEADIVITGNGGYPLDQNIYQAVKGMTAGEAACRPGGTIIMVASCSDGHGGESFFRTMADAASPAAVWEETLKVPRNRTKPDQWEYQILARILRRNRVILVTHDCVPEMVRAMHMECVPLLDSALRRAFERHGAQAKVAVIPDGVSVIVRKKS